MAPRPGNNIINYLLWPLAIIYGLITGIRNKLFDYSIIRSVEFDIPVISIGNITVGGTGKTPFVEFLVSFLKNEFKVAILSRGYKRKTNDFIFVKKHSSVAEVGDEPLQIKKKFPESIVVVDKQRIHGIRKLLTEYAGLDIILLDDAFQHRYVKPGLSILLIDYNRQISTDHYLPFGRLRDNPAEIKRAHIIVVTKCPDNMKTIDQRLILKDLKLFAYQKLFFTRINYDEIKPVFKTNSDNISNETFKKDKFDILIVTGIANSRPLRKYIRSLSPRIMELKFPDHHLFSKKDFNTINKTFEKIENEKKIIITTEKDTMRLLEYQNSLQPEKKFWYYIPIKVVFFDNKDELFRNHIINYVTKNKRHNILSAEKN